MSRTQMLRCGAALLVVIAIAACAASPKPRPAGCEQSVIYDMADGIGLKVEALSVLMEYGQAKAMRQKPTLRDDLFRAYADLKRLLDEPGATYSDVVTLAIARTGDLRTRYPDEAGLVLGAAVLYLDKPMAMTDCDRRLLSGFVARQLEMLAP